MKELALLAKKLRLVLEAQQFAETGSVEGLLQVLRDFDSLPSPGQPAYTTTKWCARSDFALAMRLSPAA